MTEISIITMQAREGAFPELVAKYEYIAEQARRSSGCQVVELFLSEERNEIAILSRWDSDDAFNDFLVWRSEQPDYGEGQEFMVSEPDIRSYVQLAPE